MAPPEPGLLTRANLVLIVYGLLNSVVGGGIHYYLWHRLVRAPDLGPPWDRALGWLFIGLALLIPVGFALVQYLPRRATRPVAAVLYGWFGIAILLFCQLVAAELVRAAIYLGSGGSGALLGSRVIAGTVGVTTLVLAGVGAVSALGRVGVRSIRVPLRRLPAALAGFHIVQISDLHVGPMLGASWVRGVVDQVNALTPDLVAITGDLADGSVSDLREHVAPIADLRARHGVFFVTGNHEYYSGADQWVAEVARLGVRVLRNERVQIGDDAAAFDLAGVDDYSARRLHPSHGADLAGALAGRDSRREVVLLAHQPRHIDEAAAHGVGLMLSGHTHGGQIFPWTWFVRLVQPYVAGLFRRGSTYIYVSRGTGFWGPPLRIGAPSEIAVLELVCDAA